MTGRVSQKVAVSVACLAAMFMTIMDVTIVNVALPTIGQTFRVPSTAVASVSIYFSVSLAVFISASGWLGDQFGGKRGLPAPVAGFPPPSAPCGVRGAVPALALCRV